MCPVTTTEVPNRTSPLKIRIRWARENSRSEANPGRISQERFAELIGTSRRHLMRLESGTTQRPRRELLARIAEESGHPLDLFLDEDEEEADRPMRVVVPVTIEIPDDQLDRALQRAINGRFIVTPRLANG